jgi:peroxiredoxin
MMTEVLQSRRSSRSSWVAALLILGLSGVNLLLAKQNLAMRKQLRARAEAVNPATQSLREGEVVASIPGTGLDGRPYEMNYNKDERKRLILFFSPSCTYCVQQAPLWRNILNKVDSSRVEVLGLVSDKLDKQEVYTHAEELGYFKTKAPLPIIFASNESLARYRLVATPTTLLVSKTGVVEHVWVGKWDETKTTEVTAALK